MEKIIDRIRKLLAVTTQRGATESEAENALAMATALMMKHGIDQAQVKDKPSEPTWSDALDNSTKLHDLIARAVGGLYGVLPVVIKNTDTFRFVGRPENIEAAILTWQMIVDQIEHLYKLALPKGLSKTERAEFRRTFKHAAALRVMTRVVQIIANMEAKGVSGSTALVVVDHRKQLQQEAQDFFTATPGNRMRSVAIRPPKLTEGAIAGVVAGDKVKLNEEVK